MSTVDVQLRAKWIARVGYRYDVILDGEVIVRRSRDPEYDAARVLRDRGYRGRFRTIDFATGRPRMILDIEKAAKLRTVERAQGGLTVEPHLPMSDADRTRLRPPSLRQGAASGAGGLMDTRERIKGAGGKTAEVARRVPEEA